MEFQRGRDGNHTCHLFAMASRQVKGHQTTHAKPHYNHLAALGEQVKHGVLRILVPIECFHTLQVLPLTAMATQDWHSIGEGHLCHRKAQV